MASLNRVVIMGNLGQDPELRYTTNQKAVCTLNVATTDYRTSPDGQKQEFTEWHRIVVWDRQAENCSKYLTKGRAVLVEGRLATRSWDDQKTGQKRYITEIIANNVQFVGAGNPRERGPMEGAGSSSGSSSGGGGGYGSGGGGGNRGGNRDRSVDSGNDFGGFGGPETPGLDDIPF
jgi:single-strand DNA-binding protein